MYVYDEPNLQLVQIPADGELEPRAISLQPGPRDNPKQGGPGGSGLAGLCASTRQAYNSREGRADARLKPLADHPFDAPADFAIINALVIPIESVATGALLGVCEVLNHRGDDGEVAPFEDEDEATLYAILRVAALAIENYQMHNANSTMRAGLLARKKSLAAAVVA